MMREGDIVAITCVAKWPQEPQFMRYQLMARLMSLKQAAKLREAAAKKPWWRFW